MHGIRETSKATRRPRRWWIAASITVAIAIGAAAFAVAAGYFDREPYSTFDAAGRPIPIGAIYFSGDVGLRLGLGATTARALARHGVTVEGVSSSTLFRQHHDRAQVDGIIATAVREGLARTGAERLVLIGQSFGADTMQTGLAALPPSLRRRIAAIVLIVPGDAVFFRADASGLAYLGAPDGIATDTAATLNWAPVTCIYGRTESHSLCPLLHQPNAQLVAMPGGHFLNRDNDAVVTQILIAIAHALRGSAGR